MFATLLQAAALSASPLPQAEALAVEDGYVLLRHIVDSKNIPAGIDPDMRLLKIPVSRSAVSLTPADQHRLLARRLPGRAFRLRNNEGIRFSVRRADRVGHHACFELNQPVAGGEWVGRDQVRPAICDSGRGVEALAFDRSGHVPVARSALDAGAYLGALDIPLTPPLPAGTQMTLRTRVGPVTIDRVASLAQPGVPGRKVFVRLSDGKVIAARLAEKGQSE